MKLKLKANPRKQLENLLLVKLLLPPILPDSSKLQIYIQEKVLKLNLKDSLMEEIKDLLKNIKIIISWILTQSQFLKNNLQLILPESLIDNKSLQ